MEKETILTLVKSRIGISSTVRDTYLMAIIESVISEFEYFYDSTNQSHIMFIVDFATWRYQNRDESGGVPRHLQFRLHNLIVGSGGKEK